MIGAAPLSPGERLDRSRARAWALQIHYRWEAQGAPGTMGVALAETLRTRRVSARRLPYVRRLAQAIDDHRRDIDATLTDALENWRIERVSRIDRGVLRLAAAEMLFFDDVPPRVSIREAIRLAEQYGGEDSPRFVNGVLDALYKRAPVVG